MFRTCMYCHRDLGENPNVEHFGIGRRLAFDQERGRLWVVCRRCRRWNLTPLEERWEAIEECERLYRDTRESYSTDNIGLARTGEGVDLVRIGKPERDEFAFWRYARTIVRRRVTSNLKNAATLAGLAVTVPIVITVSGLSYFLYPIVAFWSRRPVVRIALPDGARAHVRECDLRMAQLQRSGHEAGFALTLKYYPDVGSIWKVILGNERDQGTVRLYGADAVRAAGRILPRINSDGASRRLIRGAMGVIEEAGGPQRLFAHLPDGTPRRTWIASMPRRYRLALEMAAHEESERRALEGELAELEAAWREAEEIAAIADRLLIPPKIDEWLKKHRG